MTVKGGTSQACAACKYQRRKCTPDCPLAPFFPPDQPKMFQNAHRLYGVSNILKILKDLYPFQKIEAMRSIIYQSNMRERYPVHGCVGITLHLQQQLLHAELELEAVHTQLNIYKHHHHSQISSPPPQYSPSSQLQQLQLGSDSKNVLPLFSPQPFNSMPVGKPIPPQYQSFDNNVNIDSKDNSLWFQQAPQPQIFSSQSFPFQQPAEVSQDYNEISPVFFDNDRQSYVDSKDTYESSSESSMRDTKYTIEHVAENELKDAASRFSLTSIN